MNLFAIWPYFTVMALVLALTRLPFFALADSRSHRVAGRVSTLDGLRGFLALAVFFHHAAIYHGYLRTGTWTLPPSPFYALLGPIGVSFFFMITGYLFWGKAIDERGRLDWIKLYIGRLFRIGPAYCVMLAAVVIVVFARSDWTLREAPHTLVHELSAWFSLGYVIALPLINSTMAAPYITAGVTWTLHYEWLFYLNLLWLAVFARWRGTHLPFAIAGMITCLLLMRFGVMLRWNPGMNALLACLFFCGMVCASLERVTWFRLPSAAASLAAAVILIMLFQYIATNATPVAVILMAAAFWTVTSGGTMFGLLMTRGAQRLGNISFSIYLLQGIVLSVAFGDGSVRRFALAGPLQYWTVIALCCAVLVCVATLAYYFVERPGITLGRRLPVVRLPPLLAGRAKGAGADGSATDFVG